MNARRRSPLTSSTVIALLTASLLLPACGDDDGGSPDAGPGDGGSEADAGELHVASPDWRDQVIYFVMTDRFENGDPANDDQGHDEFDPADTRKYSGGDLQGVLDRLDYIEGLGATAVWITPPVANQWWDPLVEYGGYHGYWARHFEEVDAHVGDLDTYKALSRALHRRGMYLVQDIVANHVGNYFDWERNASGETLWNPDDLTTGFFVNAGSLPTDRPTQAPFDQIDLRDPAAREAAIYHWTPAIADYKDPEQVATWALSDLDDLNTTNPVVRDALKDSYAYWIREVGVDAFRIDTVLYVEHDFWHDFMHGTGGMMSVAEETGRDDFFAFGEALVEPEPFDDAADREVASYLGTPERPELPSVLHYPLYGDLSAVVAEGAPTAQLGYRLARTQELYPDPTRLVTFLDNHDKPRFLSRTTGDGLRQALVLLMTLPGIPVVYYGTEQGLTEGRASAFAEGWGSGGIDHFREDGPLYYFTQRAIALRKEQAVFRRGGLEVLRDNPSGAGVFAFARSHEDQRALVLVNTASRKTLVDALDTGFPEGMRLELQLGENWTQDVRVGSGGRLTAVLPARATLVLGPTDDVTSVPAPDTEVAITSTFDAPLTGDTEVSGTVTPADRVVQLVIDENAEQAIRATVNPDDGTWTATVPGWFFGPDLQTHQMVAHVPAKAVTSPRLEFQTDIQPTLDPVSVTDPAGDDTGPAGTYVLPTNSTFRDQMDILGMTVTAYGASLVVEVEMAEVTTMWNPSNGFDHVAFHIFLDLPGQDGTDVMPLLNATTPEGFAWDRMAFADGWDVRAFSPEGAAADARGTPVAAPSIGVEASTVRFTFTPDVLGVTDVAGTRVYVTTWDYDGVENRLRPLVPEGGPWAFGGGDGATDPLVLDDTEVVTVQ